MFNHPCIQFLLYKYNTLNNKKIANEIYEELRVPLFDKRKHIVDFNISKNLLTGAKTISTIYLFCHSVTGDKYEFAHIAKRILENPHNAVISYNRKFRRRNSALSSGTISLNRKYQSKFNITGCRYLLDEIIGYIAMHFKKNIVLLGFSAGTSLIACYLGCQEMKYKHNIKYSILVSAGYHYEESMRKMPKVFNVLAFFNLYFYFKEYHDKYDHTDIKKLLYLKANVLQYVLSLSKYSGFVDSKEYFLHHDPKNYLMNISSDVYFINAYDDFCFPKQTIDPIIQIYKAAKRNFTFYLEESGSHISFYKNKNETKIYDYIRHIETKRDTKKY